VSDGDVAITPSACPVCRRAVVVAQLPEAGKLRRVLVERCKRGNIALTKGLFTTDLYVYQADRVSNATTWRLHEGRHCASPQAFSAVNFHTKGQPSTYPPRRYR
jgi:hypothetical protein